MIRLYGLFWLVQIKLGPAIPTIRLESYIVSNTVLNNDLSGISYFIVALTRFNC